MSLAIARRKAARDGGYASSPATGEWAGPKTKAGFEGGQSTLSFSDERDGPALPTFSDVAAAYLADREGPTGEKTLDAFRAYLRTQLLPTFGDMPLDEIGPPAFARWFMGYSRKSPGGANAAIGLMRTIFNYAREEEIAPRTLPDPTAPVPRNRRPPRGRLLNSDQFEELSSVLADWPDQTVADAVRLISLTDCRSGEIIRLRWSEVRRDNKALSLSRAKTGPRDMALSDEAAALLRRRRRKRLGEAVFPKPDD